MISLVIYQMLFSSSRNETKSHEQGHCADRVELWSQFLVLPMVQFLPTSQLSQGLQHPSQRHRSNIYVLCKLLRIVTHFSILINILSKQLPERQSKKGILRREGKGHRKQETLLESEVAQAQRDWVC